MNPVHRTQKEILTLPFRYCRGHWVGVVVILTWLLVEYSNARYTLSQTVFGLPLARPYMALKDSCTHQKDTAHLYQLPKYWYTYYKNFQLSNWLDTRLNPTQGNYYVLQHILEIQNKGYHKKAFLSLVFLCNLAMFTLHWHLHFNFQLFLLHFISSVCSWSWSHDRNFLAVTNTLIFNC